MKKLVLKICILSFCISTFSLNAQTRIWNIHSLQNAKSLTSEAAKFILRDANKEISKSLITVMDKPMTPPSGDKHDYMSMGDIGGPTQQKPMACLISEKMVL